MTDSPYGRAQSAVANLKTAIYELLQNSDGMTNAEIGRSLGIYKGHVGHEGHIPRTLLGLMEAEGVVEQSVGDKKWKLKSHS